MERRSAGSGHSGTYGQACMQCFKSKCRCVPRADGEGCERCFRLKKSCHPSESVRRRSGQRNNDSSAQIAKLEGRIETLLAMVETVAKSAGVSASLHQPSGEGVASSEVQETAPSTGTTGTGSSSDDTDGTATRARPSTTADRAAAVAGVTPLPAHFHAPPTPSTDSGLSQPTGSSQCPSPTPPEPSADEAEEYLYMFRTRLLPFFPFIHMPADLTAAQLRRDRPLLFRAIIAVVPTSTRLRQPRAEALRRELVQATMLENHASVDLLLGLLTYIAWSSDLMVGQAGALSRFIMLAASLVYDLRLARSPEAHIIASVAPGLVNVNQGGPGIATPLGALEQHRAMLACYLLSSIISCYFSQIDALRWTAQMEDALRAVDTATECPSDQALAYQVRVQSIAQKAAYVREQHDASHAHAVGMLLPAGPPPPYLYLNALQRQLQQLRASLRPQVEQQYPMLIGYTHFVGLSINEVVRPASLDVPVLAIPGCDPVDADRSAIEAVRGNGNGNGNGNGIAGGNSGSRKDVTSMGVAVGMAAGMESSVPGFVPGSVPGFERLECLWQTVHELKCCLDIFRDLTPSACVGLPFFLFLQATRCIILAKQLFLLDDPGWDRRVLRGYIDLVGVITWMTRKADLASAEAGDEEEVLFRQFAKGLRMARAWVFARWKEFGLDEPQPEEAGPQFPGPGTDELGVSGAEDATVGDPDEMAWMQTVNQDNDRWFEDIFGWGLQAH